MPVRGAHAEPARRGLITERDRELLTWLARQRIATAAQLAERFDLSRSVAYGRLSVLAGYGLVDHVRVFHGRPGVFRATASGSVLAGQGARRPEIDLRSYAHDLELSALCAELEAEFGVARVLTERDLRAAEARSERPRYAAVLGTRRHFPDLVVERYADGLPLAVELEWTTKGARRLDSILRAYVRARHIGAVRYYACSDRVERGLMAALGRVKPPADLIEVRRGPQAAAPFGA